MKFRCKRNLWWVQQPGNTGSLKTKPGENPKEEKSMEFIEGKEYEAIPYPSGASLEYISIIAEGESGKKYTVLADELHWGATNFIRESFDFSTVGEVTGFNYSSV